MKNKLLFLVCSLLFILTSCSKDDEPSFSLKGKAYRSIVYFISHYVEETNDEYETYAVYAVWEFISDNEIVESHRIGSPTGNIIGETDKGTYILDYPKLHVQIFKYGFRYDYECEFSDENFFRRYGCEINSIPCNFFYDRDITD